MFPLDRVNPPRCSTAKTRVRTVEKVHCLQHDHTANHTCICEGNGLDSPVLLRTVAGHSVLLFSGSDQRVCKFGPLPRRVPARGVRMQIRTPRPNRHVSGEARRKCERPMKAWNWTPGERD